MNDTCEEDEKEEFLPGDMLWTKFENYPFWPCMVTYDPIDGVYIKTPQKNGKTQKTYHVQFFGQDVERGWTIPENSIPFKGEKEYGERIKALKSKMNDFGYAAPKSRSLQDKYKVQKFHKKKWEKAVKEAEEALLCSNSKERFENYVFLYENTKRKTSQGTKMQLNGDNNVFEQSEASTSKKIRYSGSSHTVCDTCQETTAEFSCSGICKKSFHLGCVGLTITPVNFKCIECLSASGKPTKKMKAWLDPVYASSKNFDKIFPKNVYTELGQFQPLMQPLLKLHKVPRDHQSHVGGPFPLQITSERRGAAVNPNDHSKMKPSMKAPSLQSHGQSMQGIRSPSPREVCHRMPPVAVHSKKNSPPPSPQVQVVNGPPMTGSRGPPSGVVGHTMPLNPMVKGGPAIMRKPLPKWMQNFLQTQILQTEADPRECNVQLREGMFKAEENKVITAESAPPGKYEEVYRLVHCPHHVVPYGLDRKKT